MTAKALETIGTIGGHRFCKRDSFLAIETAIDYVKDEFGIEMGKENKVCQFSNQNNQCIGNRCPYHNKG